MWIITGKNRAVLQQHSLTRALECAITKSMYNVTMVRIVYCICIMFIDCYVNLYTYVHTTRFFFLILRNHIISYMHINCSVILSADSSACVGPPCGGIINPSGKSTTYWVSFIVTASQSTKR